jgi:hypothetical protein
MEVMSAVKRSWMEQAFFADERVQLADLPTDEPLEFDGIH